MAHKNRSNWSPYKARKNNPQGSQKPASDGPSRHRKPTETYSFNEADDRIHDVFRNHGFGDYPHTKRQQLTEFYQLLMNNQNERNFTRLLNLKDVAIKHFIDSLIVTQLRPLMFPLLDMGTGPGFPGIPLAIHHPDKKIILAEGVQKRVEFLKSVRDEMGLKNVAIIGRNVNLEFFYPVNGVITRAVEDARNTLGNVINCVQTGGEVVLMKGPNCTPEIQMALDAWGEYFELAADIPYELPKTPHERRLLVFKKLKAHPLPDFEDLDLKWEREFGRDE
ncbi:MAG TPA: RsmG family class I SAM-dependent methyltransferase [Bdellovibrionales bacterium]|nr:RsmG family class I SAM-dependent methyltransferase [Bdellovibrionales bacterium]